MLQMLEITGAITEATCTNIATFMGLTHARTHSTKVSAERAAELHSVRLCRYSRLSHCLTESRVPQTTPPLRSLRQIPTTIYLIPTILIV